MGGGGILGAAVAESASAEALEAAYGELAHEARARLPAYRPKTVCTDGWDATQSAWKSLFPAVCIIRCFLHAVLNVSERCGRDLALRTLVLDRVWEVYEARTRAQFSQRLRRLREWATTRLSEGQSGRWSSSSAARAHSSCKRTASLQRIGPPMPSIGS